MVLSLKVSNFPFAAAELQIDLELPPRRLLRYAANNAAMTRIRSGYADYGFWLLDITPSQAAGPAYIPHLSPVVSQALHATRARGVPPVQFFGARKILLGIAVVEPWLASVALFD